MKDLLLKDREWVKWIIEEHTSQVQKWGVQDHDWIEWVGIISEELMEFTKEAIQYYFRNDLDGKREQKKKAVIKEAIQAATLLLRFAEMVKKYE